MLNKLGRPVTAEHKHCHRSSSSGTLKIEQIIANHQTFISINPETFTYMHYSEGIRFYRPIFPADNNIKGQVVFFSNLKGITLSITRKDSDFNTFIGKPFESFPGLVMQARLIESLLLMNSFWFW